MELFEQPEWRKKDATSAILIQVILNSDTHTPDPHEFTELAASSGVDILGLISHKRAKPDPKTFIGRGKAEELKLAVDENKAELVIFDHQLSPAQERNLEHEIQCRVLDRTGLILDIFSRRATSHEGKLQVELAQLKHLSTRLIRGWTHLERQKGGVGLRGPGETQLETDRRLIGTRIKQISKKIERISRQRQQGRKFRKKSALPTVSLVGYTNAGKSTLFNALTGADVYAQDQLFATLDPTLRRLKLPTQQTIMLADTVGFIRNLPHDLVLAFRATLQETIEADLILHVIDASNPERDEYRDHVNEVIEHIEAQDVPQLEVINKIDLIERQPSVQRNESGEAYAVWVSAAKQQGLEALKQAITDFFVKEVFSGTITLPPSAAKLRAQLYEYNAISAESISEKGEYILTLNIQSGILESELQQAGLDLAQIS